MGRLTEDMTRLVGEIHAARRERRRWMRELENVTLEMRRAVAHLRGAFAADLAGARAVWFGATARAMGGVSMPGASRPRVWDVAAEGEAVLAGAAEERARLEAARSAPDESPTARKARGRQRMR